MTIKIGDTLPEGTLAEFIETETEGCALGPNTFNVQDLVKGKKIAIFGLPGAFTPTCSAQHVPGYVQHADDLKAAGVDEIWCISVNDAFVMGAWGRDQKATGIVRMMGDGNAAYSKALGLDADFSKHGMGTRSQRYSLLADNGVVTQLNIEQGGKFEVSNAETLLGQLDKLIWGQTCRLTPRKNGAIRRRFFIAPPVCVASNMAASISNE